MKPIDIDTTTQDAVRRFLGRISSRYDVDGAVLFGSRARGTFGPESDADLAVILRGTRKRVLPVSLDMADQAYEVLLQTAINLSPLPIWKEDWNEPDRHSNPELIRTIKAEGLRLSDR
jgi:uncharacterized protein